MKKILFFTSIVFFAFSGLKSQTIDSVIVINPVLCFGDQSGSVIIDSIIGGNMPYDVQWGGINNFALSAGTYSVHIVDAIGCLHTEVYVISQGTQINPNEVLYPPLCYGDANGSISIDITAGAGPLSYYWLNGTGTADSLYGLVDSIYTLIAVDASCIDTFNFSLQSPSLLDVDLIVLDSALTCFGAHDHTQIISRRAGPHVIYRCHEYRRNH